MLPVVTLETRSEPTAVKSGPRAREEPMETVPTRSAGPATRGALGLNALLTVRAGKRTVMTVSPTEFG